MVKKITFKIDPQGGVTLDVQGAQGASCEDLTKPFEAVLGEVQTRTHKDSYYQEAQVESQEAVRNDS